MKNPVFLLQPVFFLAEDQLAFVQEGNVVADLFQVADNVGGDQNGVVFVPGEFVKNVHDLVPDDRVKAAGGLVQNQKPGVVGQGDGNAKLHFHAPGKILEFLVRGDGQPGQIVGKNRLVPAAVNALHDLAHLPGGETGGDAHLVQHNADLLFGKAQVLPVVPAQNGDGAAVPGNGVENQLDGGAFSRAVFAHKPHNAAPGQGQIQMIQGKTGVVLG